MRHLKSTIKKATATRRGKIIAGSVLLVILSGIAGGIIYWNAYKKQIIRNELESTIRKKTKGLYALKYDSLSLDEVNGYLLVTNFRLQFDSSRYAALKTTNDAPPVLLNLTIPVIEVMGVKTPRALLDKEIVGKNLHIRNPGIEIWYTNAGKDSARNVPTREVYEQILGDLNLIKVDTIEISNAEIVTKTLRTGKENLRINETYIRLADVAIDSVASRDTTRLVFAKDILLNAGTVAWSSDNGLYNYSADSVEVRSATRSVYVRQFRIDPTKNEHAFVHSLPTQDDRFDFTLRGIRISQIQSQELLDEHIIADSLLIQSSTFKIYRDLSIPRDKKNRVGTYPHQVVEKIPLPINIRKLVLANSFIEYKEKNPRTNQAGKVQFYNVYATLSNVTNMDEAIKANNVMTANVGTRFLNKTPLEVTWKFYLQHPKGRFDLSGNMGTIAFTDVNQLTVPMGPARLEEGQLKSLRFDLDGSDYAMNGKVKMLYDGLKISVLEKEEGKKELDKKTIASLAANIIIKNSNPSKEKDEPRVIDINLERNTNRSIFYFIWMALFKGIKESTGIKK